MDENELSHKVIGAALKLHTMLGPGLLESVYECALAYDLSEAGLQVERQRVIPFVYKGVKMESAFRADLLVNDKVLIEMKSVESLADIHYAQTLTYLRLANKKLALLINFNEKHLRTGIHRIVNNL